MIIEIDNSRLLIHDNDNKLHAVVKSQLSFWNFEFDYSSNTYSISLDKQLFLKVIKYFESEGLQFTYGKKAKKYSKEIAIVSLNFENLKSTAANYKNGKYDKVDFDDFRKFVAQNILRTLKIHQLKAAYHLYILGNGANFSVPGSGKTSVVLTVYEKLRLEEKVNTLFVVGPPSAFGPWRNEFRETLGRNPHSVVMAGGNKSDRKNLYYKTSTEKRELYLTSFQSLLSDQREAKQFLGQQNVKALFVVDEAHYIKQINGEWAQAILKLAEMSAYRVVLTGTPMPKSYTDIFNLFDFLWPNHPPISSNHKSLIKFHEQNESFNAAKGILDSDIGPLFYRVRKSDLKLKPQNFIKPYIIEMNPHERKVYDAVYKKIVDYSKADFYKNIEFINAVGRGRIMRLRQAVSYTKLLNTAIQDYDENLMKDLTDLKNVVKRYDGLEVPAKLTELIKIVKRLKKQNQKVVIWSNFIETIKLIQRHLTQDNIYCKRIIGDTPVERTTQQLEETREKIRDEFVDPDSGLDVLIANPAACAESISLHKTCHHAIYYDLTYNCAQYLQSLDRIHRVGGSEVVQANYHFLQYKNSIDADIKKNIDEKKDKMFSVIEQDYTIYSLNMSEPDGDAEAYRRIFLKRDRRKKN